MMKLMVDSVVKYFLCVLEWERRDKEIREKEGEANWNYFRLIVVSHLARGQSCTLSQLPCPFPASQQTSFEHVLSGRYITHSLSLGPRFLH